MAGSAGAKRLIKGDLLFREGDVSNAMYLIRGGSVRIFKKKGDAQIEIDTLRAGQILGEMAFLDGNPRSASAQAMTDTELVEISKSIYDATMVQVPEWLKVLLKAIVARLRSTTTKLKNLESSSTEMNYADGKRNFTFISPHDALKVATATLLAASLTGETDAEKKVKGATIERYANQVMGVPLAKVTAFFDVLREAGALKLGDDGKELTVTDGPFLQEFIQYVCDENLTEPSKRHDISLRGFAAMECIVKHLDEYPRNVETGKSDVNIAAIKKTDSEALGREAFRMEEFEELVRVGYATSVKVLSSEEQVSYIPVDAFKKAFRFQQVLKVMEKLNEEKQKTALGYR